MSPLAASVAQLMVLQAAFWVAVLSFRARTPDATDKGLRFIGGVLLGAVLAHVGGVALYADRLESPLRALLNPSTGFSVLLVPAGILAVTPWRASNDTRINFLAPALGSLPVALAVARVGCLVSGCCQGLPTAHAWGHGLIGSAGSLHPTGLYEIAGLLIIHLGARRLPAPAVGPFVLMGIGIVRFVVEPWRATPAFGEPLLAPALLATCWVLVGFGLGLELTRRPRLGSPAS